MRIPARFYLVATLLLLFASTLSAQRTPRWEVVDSLAMEFQNTSVRCIAGEDAGSIVVIGFETAIDDEKSPSRAANVVRRSLDSGTSWQRLYFGPAAERWRDVAHPTRDLIVVTGDSSHQMSPFTWEYRYHGMFLVSRNGGASWTRRYLDSNSMVGRISMADGSHGIMQYMRVGNRDNHQPDSIPDRILRTTDAWRTWSDVALPPDVETLLNLVALTPDRWLIVVNAVGPKRRQIYLTFNAGATWAPAAESPELYQLSFIDSLNGWGSGSRWNANGIPIRNRIWKTTDGGATWANQYDQTVDDGLSSIGPLSFGDRLNGLVVRRDRFLRTTDGGIRWTAEYIPSALDSGSTFPANVLMPSGDLAFSPVRIYGTHSPVAISAVIRQRAGESALLPPHFLSPDLSAPADTSDVLVEWTPIEGASRYRLQIVARSLDTNVLDFSLFNHPELDTITTATSVMLNRLRYNHGYYARVRAIGSNGEESDWFRAAYLFVTRKAPLLALGTAGIISPPLGATGVRLPVKVTWSAVVDAITYELQISEQSDYSAPVVDRTDLVQRELTVNELSVNRTYYTRVRARHGTVVGQWSSIASRHFFNTIESTAGVETEEAESLRPLLRALPNPASGVISIEYAGAGLRPGASLTIHDARGMTVAMVSVPTLRTRFDVTSLSPGIYLLHFVNGEESATVSIAVVH